MRKYNSVFNVVLSLKLEMTESGLLETTFEITLGKKAHLEREARAFMKDEVAKRFDCSIRFPVYQAPFLTVIDQLPVMELREVFASTSN
jgi:hypothetical protein